MGKLAYFHRVAAHSIFDSLHQDIPHKQTQAYFILTKLLPSHFPKGQDGLVHFGMLNPNQCRFAITELVRISKNISRVQAEEMVNNFFDDVVEKEGRIRIDFFDRIALTSQDLVTLKAATEEEQNRFPQEMLEQAIPKEEEAGDKNRSEINRGIEGSVRQVLRDIFVRQNLSDFDVEENSITKSWSKEHQDKLQEIVSEIQVSVSQDPEKLIEHRFIEYLYMRYGDALVNFNLNNQLKDNDSSQGSAVSLVSLVEKPKEIDKAKKGKKKKSPKEEDEDLDKFLADLAEKNSAENEQRDKFDEMMTSVQKIIVLKKPDPALFKTARKNISFYIEKYPQDNQLLLVLGDLSKVKSMFGNIEYFDDLIERVLSKLQQQKSEPLKITKDGGKGNKKSETIYPGNLNKSQYDKLNYEIFCSLYKSGCEFDVIQSFLERYYDMNNPYNYFRLLAFASKQSSDKMLSDFLAKDADRRTDGFWKDVTTYKVGGHSSAIMLAISIDQPKIVEKLLGKPGDLSIDTLINPFGFVCYMGDTLIAQKIIEAAGKNVMDLLTKKISKGITPILIAAQEGCEEILENIFKAAGKKAINLLEGEGESCLISAAKNGHLKVVIKIIEVAGDKIFDLIQTSNRIGANALMCAAQKGHLDVMEALLKAVKREDALKFMGAKFEESGLGIVALTLEGGRTDADQVINMLGRVFGDSEQVFKLIEEAGKEIKKWGEKVSKSPENPSANALLGGKQLSLV